MLVSYFVCRNYDRMLLKITTINLKLFNFNCIFKYVLRNKMYELFFKCAYAKCVFLKPEVIIIRSTGVKF